MKVSMPTLFPPLETQDDGASGKSALPAELKANFEAIQAISRAQRRLEQQERILQSGGTSSGGAAGAKRKQEGAISSSVADDAGRTSSGRAEALERRKLQLAAETAVAVESEISRLTNGIAELEELLARQGETHANDPVEISFPSLPSVVPDDDSEEEARDSGKQASDSKVGASEAKETV